MVRSMERTTRALLVNVNKQYVGRFPDSWRYISYGSHRNPTGPMASRVQQYIDRLAQSRVEVFDEISRKRAAPIEPTDGLDQAKRAKLGAEVPEKLEKQLPIPPLSPGPVTVAQLFTLTPDEALKSFDVQQFPVYLVVQLLLAVMGKVNPGLLEQAVEVSHNRTYLCLGGADER